MESGKLAAFLALKLFVEEKNIDLRGISRIFLEQLYFLFIFISIFILLTRRKATEALYIG